MKKICKKLTTVVLAAAISVLAAATSYAEETINCTTSFEHHSEEFKKLGYIPDAGLGTPIKDSFERNWGYFFYLYPDGSYYSKDGTECKCHKGRNNPCTVKDPGNCLVFDNSIQCMAFAKNVYYETHDYMFQVVIEEHTDLDADKAKRLFLNAPRGTYLRVRTSSGDDHSIAITYTSGSSGVAVYHANYGGSCLVKYESYTWENFPAAFPYLYSYAT